MNIVAVAVSGKNLGIISRQKLDGREGKCLRFMKAFQWTRLFEMLNTKWYVMRCTIWYYLYNLKNMKNAHGGALLLVKLQAKSLQLY